MAPTTESQIRVWDTDFFRQFVRSTPYSPFMGRGNGEGARMPILLNRSLASGGKTVNMPFVGALTGDGVQGTTRLAGNEEDMATFNQAIHVNYNRHGVVVKDPDERFTGLDLRNEARVGLMNWAMTWLKRDITTALMAYDNASYVNGKDAETPTGRARDALAVYLDTSEAKKDAWLTANLDRFLFGASQANAAAGDHSAALLNVDAVNDRMSTKVVSLAKEMAESTEQAITPFQVDEDLGREQWVMFMGVRAFRDLKNDPIMQQANRDARVRGENNPIFQDGDLLWDGVVIRSVRDIPLIPGVGDAGVDVQASFLVGAGAVGVAWGQKPTSKTKKEDDYDFERGVGVQECRGVAKLARGGKQNGQVTVFTAAPPSI